jgi:carbonic anhydrase
MWIGCSDSRIPETTVLDLLPGDLYVHRNLANIVSTDDMSLLADVQYAVEVLGVNHIIICGIPTLDELTEGHYGCGGCSTALGHKDLGLIDNWLRHVRDVRNIHSEELDLIPDAEARSNRLVELKLSSLGVG